MNEDSPSRHRFVTLAPLTDPRVQKVGADSTASPGQPATTADSTVVSPSRSQHPQQSDDDGTAKNLTINQHHLGTECKSDAADAAKRGSSGSENSVMTDRSASLESLGDGNGVSLTEAPKNTSQEVDPQQKQRENVDSKPPCITENSGVAGDDDVLASDSRSVCSGFGKGSPVLPSKALHALQDDMRGNDLGSAAAEEQAATKQNPVQSTPPTSDLTSNQLGLGDGAGDCLSSSTSSESHSPRDATPDVDAHVLENLQGVAASTQPPMSILPGGCDEDKPLHKGTWDSSPGPAVDRAEATQQLECASAHHIGVDTVRKHEEGGNNRPAASGAPASSKASIGLVGAGSGPWHHWQEPELPDVEPLSGQVLRIFCGVWNLHGKSAPADLSAWLVTHPRHHVYVIGTCECERSIEKSMIWADKSRWEAQVCNHLGGEFRMIRSHNMSAIHVMVFVHRYLWRYIWDIKSAQVATGFGNVIGNKGGTQIGFNIGRTSMLCVNAHLAAHAKKMKERTQNLARILVDSPMRREKSSSGVHEDYDRVFFMGDLNPRVNAKRSDVDAWLAGRQLDKCLEKDQLLPLLQSELGDQADGFAGMWPWFEEAAIRFPPTYKFDTHTDRYDSSKKQRVPSWTDRILWKRDSQVRPLAYGSIQSLQCSDHRPIFAQFEVMVDLDRWEGPELGSVRDKKSTVCSLQ